MKNNTLSVLIIDDEDIKKNLVLCIEKSGHLADIAESCEEALIKLTQRHYDLVFIDVNLPDGGGIELMGKAKALYPELRIVAMTGGVERSDEVRIRKHRVIYLLIKPFTGKEIQEILDHVARRKGDALGSDNILISLINKRGG